MNQPLTPEMLEGIKERAERATKGPWTWNEDKWNGGLSGMSGASDAEVIYPQHRNEGDDGAAWFEEIRNEDAQFIAHARTDIPLLLAHIESQARRVEEGERRLKATDLPDLETLAKDHYNDDNQRLGITDTACSWENVDEVVREYQRNIIRTSYDYVKAQRDSLRSQLSTANEAIRKMQAASYEGIRSQCLNCGEVNELSTIALSADEGGGVKQ